MFISILNACEHVRLHHGFYKPFKLRFLKDKPVEFLLILDLTLLCLGRQFNPCLTAESHAVVLNVCKSETSVELILNPRQDVKLLKFPELSLLDLGETCHVTHAIHYLLFGEWLSVDVRELSTHGFVQLYAAILVG